MPHFVAGKIDPSVLKAQIEALAPELLPVYEAAIQFLGLAENAQTFTTHPFHFYISGGAARKIVVQHFFGAERAKLHRKPADIDYKLIRPELPAQVEADFKRDTVNLYRKFHDAVSKASPTVTFNSETTDRWMISKGVGKTQKSVDIALSYENTCQALPSSISLLIEPLTGEIIFYDLDSYQKFMNLEIEISEINTLLQSDLDLEPHLKQRDALLSSTEKDKPQAWRDEFKKVRAAIGPIEQRIFRLGNYLYSARVMMDCGFKLGPYTASAFSNIILDEKKNKQVLDIYNDKAHKKSYKKMERLDQFLFPIISKAKPAEGITAGISSQSSDTESISSAGSMTTHDSRDGTGSGLSDDTPQLVDASVKTTDAIIHTELRHTAQKTKPSYLDILNRTAMQSEKFPQIHETKLEQKTKTAASLPAAKPVKNEACGNPPKKAPVVTEAKIMPAVVIVQQPETLQNKPGLVLPIIHSQSEGSANHPLQTTQKVLQPELQLQAVPNGNIPFESIPPAALLPDKKQHKKVIGHRDAAVLQSPKFSGDVDAFIAELDIFIKACDKNTDVLAQNRLLISAIDHMMHFIKAGKNVSSDQKSLFNDIISRPLWSTHNLDMSVFKKFIAPGKNKSSVLKNSVDNTPMPIPNAASQSKTSDKTIEPSLPLPVATMPALKSPWIFCGIIPTLGYYLINHAAYSSPHASLLLGVMATAAVGAEYWVKCNRVEKLNASIQAFQQEKIKFEADPSWDKTQFTALIEVLSHIPNRNMTLLTGNNPKTVFLRKVIAIQRVLIQHNVVANVSDYGLGLLNAIISCYGGLEQAAHADYLFLAEPACQIEGATKVQSQRHAINDYFVSGAPVENAEAGYVKNLAGNMKYLTPALAYQVAYYHKPIQILNTAAVKTLHHKYPKGVAQSVVFDAISAVKVKLK